MALFKIKRGSKKNLPTTYNDGYCYFTTDDGKFYIDTSDDETGRVLLNAGTADALTVKNVGGPREPIYIDENGVPVPCTSTLRQINGALHIHSEGTNEVLKLKNTTTGTTCIHFSNSNGTLGILQAHTNDAHDLRWIIPTAEKGDYGTYNTILHAGNYNTYVPKLDGTGAYGNWDIKATTATLADYATNIQNNTYPSALKIESSSTQVLKLNNKGTGSSTEIVFQKGGTDQAILSAAGSDLKVTKPDYTGSYIILHANNYTDYAAPKSHTHDRITSGNYQVKTYSSTADNRIGFVSTNTEAGNTFYLMATDTTATAKLRYVLYSNGSNVADGYIYTTLNKPTLADIGAMASNPTYIEFKTASSAGHGGYLDFHYNGSTTDYTSRIIESASGTLTIPGNLTVGTTLTVGSTNILTTLKNKANASHSHGYIQNGVSSIVIADYTGNVPLMTARYNGNASFALQQSTAGSNNVLLHTYSSAGGWQKGGTIWTSSHLSFSLNASTGVLTITHNTNP